MTTAEITGLLLRAMDDIKSDIAELKQSVSTIDAIKRDVSDTKRSTSVMAEQLVKQNGRIGRLETRAAQTDAVAQAFAARDEDERSNHHAKQLHLDARMMAEVGVAASVLGAIIGAVLLRWGF